MSTPNLLPLSGIVSSTLDLQLSLDVREANPGDATVPVATINQSNALHQLYGQLWRDIDVLHQGSRVLQLQADRFLLKRPKEPNDIYIERVKGFTYHNLMDLGVGYYRAKLFEDDPEIDIKQSGKALVAPAETTDTKDPEVIVDPADAVWHFYVEQFLVDCDGGRTSYVEFFKLVMASLLLYQRAYILMDLPAGTQNAATAADQNIRPLLKLYGPQQVINYEVDDRGNLNWILIRVESQDHSFLKRARKIVRWHYFDRTEFFTYEWREGDKRPEGVNSDVAKLVGFGNHSMADYKDDETGNVTGRVPVHVIEVTSDFWIANRVFLPMIDHLNVDNSYSFALKQGNLAMPVITSDSEFQPTLAECGFIMLPQGATFAWAEPSGTSYQRSQERIDSLREEIFRLMHLQAQGKSSTAVASAQSGYSKEQDMAPAHDILESMGDLIRTNMQIVLYLVAAIRQETTLDFDVRGFEFEEREVLPEIEAVAALQAVQVRSETFAREVEKSLVRSFGRDWNPELVKTIEAEIDAAPSNEELQQQELQQDQKMLTRGMQTAAERLVTKPPTQD